MNPATDQAPPARPPELPDYVYLSPDAFAARESRPAPPAPEQPVFPSPRRRRSAGLAAVVVTVAAVGAAVAIGVGREGGGNESAQPAVADAQLPAQPGVVATASVQAADTVAVVEVVSWPDGGPAEIRLGVPALGALPGIPAAFDPGVAELEVTLDGNAAPLIADATGWTVPYSADAPSSMVVRYVMSGALVRSSPSESGRALFLVAPLSTPAVGSLPVRVLLPQAGVLGVACPAATRPVDQLCGRRETTGWTAQTPSESPAVVVVQLDLPPA